MEDFFACQICGSPDGRFHFGAITCRACAAFFRRYVNSKKPTISCRCNNKTVSKYPCRLCRLRKCESFGMKKHLVQPPRDSNPSPKKSDSCSNSEAELFIEKPIALRTMDRLENVKMNYSILCNDRDFLRCVTNINTKLNMYELSCVCIDDSKFISSMIERTFPEMSSFRDSDKENMFSNFYSKWIVLECCTHCEKTEESWNFVTPFGHLLHPIENFYKSSRNDRNLSETETKRIFEPYWSYFTDYLVPQINGKRLHNIEYMALLALSFLDSGYLNLSNECVDLCDKLKPLYLKELYAYYKEMNYEDADARFFETLDILLLVEKGEIKAQEELQMCFVYDVLVNDDYRKLFINQKY